MLNRTIKFIRMLHDDDETVMDEKTARTLGIVDNESLQAHFGDRARWCSIVLLPSSKRLTTQIDRETYVLDPVVGPRKDAALLPQKRAVNVIESWSGFSEKLSEEAYLDLPANVADYIDAQVLARLYPSAEQNPDFFGMWSRLLAASVKEKSSPKESSTKE